MKDLRKIEPPHVLLDPRLSSRPTLWVIWIDGVEESFREEHLDGEVDSILRGRNSKEASKGRQSFHL
jgi:hypothetical protein